MPTNQYLRSNSSLEPPTMSHHNSKTSDRGTVRAPLGQRSMNFQNQGPASKQTSLPVKNKPAPSLRQSTKPKESRESNEPIEIEERRRKPNGEGYTIHRYLRGKMLGKGGFAKVYHCTSLDTNRSYAVKIVHKANLVKSRARQKVCEEFVNLPKVHCSVLINYLCFVHCLMIMYFALFSSYKPRLRSTDLSNINMFVSTNISSRIRPTAIFFLSYAIIRV